MTYVRICHPTWAAWVKCQHNRNGQLISPPLHPSAVPYVALGLVSNDDTKIIEEIVVSLFKTVSSFKNAKQSYPGCLYLFRNRRVQHPYNKRTTQKATYECARSLVQSIWYGCTERESGWTPIVKQSRVCGRSVTFSLCNLDTGMTNTINLSPFTSGNYLLLIWHLRWFGVHVVDPRYLNFDRHVCQKSSHT